MTCNKCDAPISLEDSTEHTGEGSFTEKYECANGHRGRISGDEAAPPTQWRKSGPVFN